MKNTERQFVYRFRLTLRENGKSICRDILAAVVNGHCSSQKRNGNALTLFRQANRHDKQAKRSFVPTWDNAEQARNVKRLM